METRKKPYFFCIESASKRTNRFQTGFDIVRIFLTVLKRKRFLYDLYSYCEMCCAEWQKIAVWIYDCDDGVRLGTIVLCVVNRIHKTIPLNVRAFRKYRWFWSPRRALLNVVRDLVMRFVWKFRLSRKFRFVWKKKALDMWPHE